MSIPWTDETLSWLLDPADPGPRHLALRDLLGRAPDDPELLEARAAAHVAPPIAPILEAMEPEGYWVKPGSGYSPKYRGTVWSVIALAQMGASAAADPRVARAGTYLLDHALTPAGQFSTSIKVTPSGTVDCLQGNLLMSLLDLGIDDERLDVAFEWMARTVTGEGIAPAEDKKARLRYYAYKSGPLFQCGVNADLPCGWGAAKVMLAFAKLPEARRTRFIDEAIRQGAEFLLSVDPATAAYPVGYGDRPSSSWFKFGFPVFYVTDILQVVEALVALGYRDDPRLAQALAFVSAKADADGRWPLEYDYTGKGWKEGEVRGKKRPNKWVTIRALRVLSPAKKVQATA
jgi:hypothetical protein